MKCGVHPNMLKETKRIIPNSIFGLQNISQSILFYGRQRFPGLMDSLYLIWTLFLRLVTKVWMRAPTRMTTTRTRPAPPTPTPTSSQLTWWCLTLPSSFSFSTTYISHSIISDPGWIYDPGFNSKYWIRYGEIVT